MIFAPARLLLSNASILAALVITGLGQSGWAPPAKQELPSTLGLPDPLRLADGSPVLTAEHWSQRREEMKAMLLYYQYGRIPPRPDRVTAILDKRVERADGKGHEEWLTLQIDSRKQLAMRMVLYLPARESGPFPVVIREEGTLGRTRQVPMFLDAGYAFVEYARHDLDPDKKGVVGPAQAAYPNFDWATLAVWAWGGMRVVDYLESRPEIDRERVAITGHSRGGKMALLAGALDERFTLVVPNGSGAGGAGASRILGPGAESVGMNDKPHWYHERIQWFGGREDRLPFDQHFLKALVAPRALLCTESTDDLFANPHGTQGTTRAAQRVYHFLKAPPGRHGIHFRTGEHASNDDDWRALLDFAQWHFFDRRPAEPDRFWELPDPPLEPPAQPMPIKATGPWVRVGHPGNPPDADHEGVGRFGQVSSSFEISSTKVSRAEYAAFLNAVARRDRHGLYRPSMPIDRQGDEGRHVYRPRPPVGAPITHASWVDALRYCNWWHNGKPSGPQISSTTEDGAYPLTAQLDTITRTENAKYFLPTVNEWYKAAYYRPESQSYGHLPLPDKPDGQQGWQHFNRSHYGMKGTEDGIWEWTESPVGRLFKAIRSDAWFQGNNRQAAGHFYSNPHLELSRIGFRIAKR